MPIDTAQLYEAHGPMVLRRCRRLLRDDAKALDAMHDVFVEILRREQTLDLRAPAGLLLRTATNVCLNKLRTERRHPEDREERLLFAIAAHADDSPETRVLSRSVLDRLFRTAPASSRMMAVLHYVDELTLEEVADEVGLSVSGVRKRLRTLQAELASLNFDFSEGRNHG
jgi:RNA polymerase sigma-70 factor (ECF subfamily)